MQTWRFFFHGKRGGTRGLSSITFLAAIFTMIALTSCAGVTKPCVTCKRELASDPFENAEEANWEEGDTASEKARRERRGNLRKDL